MSREASFYDRAFDVDATIERLKDRFQVTSDKDFAKMIGISQSTLSSWKNRQSIPLAYIVVMSRIFRVSTDYILFGEGIIITVSATEADESVMKLSFMASIAQAIESVEEQIEISERGLRYYRILRTMATSLERVSGMSLEKNLEIISHMADELAKTKG